jgi:hypothetical protein
MGKPSKKSSARKNPGQERLGNDNSGTLSSGNSSNVNVASIPEANLSPNRDESTLNKEANEVADSSSGSGSENLDVEEENLETDFVEKWINRKLIQILKMNCPVTGMKLLAGLHLGSGKENLGNEEGSHVNIASQEVVEMDLLVDTGADLHPSSRKRAGSGSHPPQAMAVVAEEEPGELNFSSEPMVAFEHM